MSCARHSLETAVETLAIHLQIFFQLSLRAVGERMGLLESMLCEYAHCYILEETGGSHCVKILDSLIYLSSS
jgi:hypothetical protein